MIQVNFSSFCALVWDKQSPRSLLGILGLNTEPIKDSQVIAIFSEQECKKPIEYEFVPNKTDLDDLPLNVVQTIKALHEANQLTIRRKKMQEKSPLIKKNHPQSPKALKDTRHAL